MQIFSSSGLGFLVQVLFFEDLVRDRRDISREDLIHEVEQPHVPGLEVPCFGFEVPGLMFEVLVSIFEVPGFVFEVPDFMFEAPGCEILLRCSSRVQNFRVSGSGYRVPCFVI